MFRSELGETVCLEHAQAPCDQCDTPIQHDFLSGCGHWTPIDPALAIVLHREFVRTDDPIIH